MMESSYSKYIRILLILFAGSLPWWLFQFSGLKGMTIDNMMVLSIFCCAVSLWILKVFPDYITALLMLTAIAISKAASFADVFSAFSMTTTWLVIGAFILSSAIECSGLLRRFSLFMMSKFPLTYMGQTSGMMLSSLIIAPMIPSAAGKSAVLAPLAKAVNQNMGYAPQSNASAGIFAAMYVPNGMLYAIFLSASFMNYMMLGMMPADLQDSMTWFHWLLYASIWGIVILVAMFSFIQIYYRPRNQKVVADNGIENELKALGHMTRKERIVLCVLAVCLLFWMTERMHGINATLVVLLAVCALTITGVIDVDVLKKKVPWDLIIFLGAVVGCGTIFKRVGLDNFFAENLSRYVAPLLEQYFVVFIVVMSFMIYALRIIISSQTAALTIFVLLLTPIAIKAGVSPWVPAYIVYTAGLVFIVRYQNITYLTTLAMVALDLDEGKKEKALVLHEQMIPLSVYFMFVSVLGHICSIPLWRFLGLI